MSSLELVVELNGEKSEKQSMQSRMWSLDRNIKNLQAERDMLEKKLKDCIGTFNGMRISLEKVSINKSCFLICRN